MIKPIVRDTFFLQQKSQMASRADVSLAKDLQDTLHANQNYCVGMAANMIGSLKRVIIINVGITNLVMFNPVLVAKSDLSTRVRSFGRHIDIKIGLDKISKPIFIISYVFSLYLKQFL
ncbi:TPA: peptide deformylase [Streptococcus agalactiae]